MQRNKNLEISAWLKRIRFRNLLSEPETKLRFKEMIERKTTRIRRKENDVRTIKNKD